jgi:hypothetical protein
MLKHGEPNPLNVHGLRQLAHCPPHFEQVVFDPQVGEKDICDWIYENLEGRFYLGIVDISRTPGGKPIDRNMLVAFELASEASYFSLSLPQINSNNIW